MRYRLERLRAVKQSAHRERVSCTSLRGFAPRNVLITCRHALDGGTHSKQVDFAVIQIFTGAVTSAPGTVPIAVALASSYGCQYIKMKVKIEFPSLSSLFTRDDDDDPRYWQLTRDLLRSLFYYCAMDLPTMFATF